MHSSFRASKLILSKVGTAASFGFGVNAGARYSDSQSGHRFAIEEARSLSRPEPAPFDVLLGDVLEHADGGGGRGGRDSALMDVQLVDVDRSDLLFGYSTACFSACSGSGRTAAAAVTAVATVASQLSASSSSSTSIREVSSSQQAQKQVMQSLHRDKKQQQQSRQLEGGGREMVERSLAETRAISSSSSRDSHHIVASQNHHHPRHSAAPHKQLHTIHTHEIHQTQPSKHCRDHQKKYLHKLNQQSKQGLPYEHQLQQEFLRPLPFPRLNEEEDLKEEDEKDEKFELKVESVTVAPLVSNDSGEVVTWDSLLENHKCTICSDLLAGE